MSKLSTLLRRVARSEPTPLGFTAFAGRAKNPEMLAGVTIAKLDQANATAAAEGGASFILLDDGDLQKDADKIRAITGAVDLPCGLRVAKSAGSDAAGARALGLDYLRIEDDETPASALLDEEMGYVLAVADDASDTYLRMLESMPFDAIYAGSVSHPFTIRRQLELRRLSGFAHKPLLLKYSDELSPEDLECLRDSGVAALVLDGDDLAQQLPKVRSAIEGMRPRRRRRDDRGATPVLPSVSHGGEEEDDED